MAAEQLSIFSSLNIFISRYTIFNFYCDIFLLVHAEQGLKIKLKPRYDGKITLEGEARQLLP